jgi:hypothetical protein
MRICYTLYDDQGVEIDAVALELDDEEALEEFSQIKATLAKLADDGELEQEDDGGGDRIFEDE